MFRFKHSLEVTPGLYCMPAAIPLPVLNSRWLTVSWGSDATLGCGGSGAWLVSVTCSQTRTAQPERGGGGGGGGELRCTPAVGPQVPMAVCPRHPLGSELGNLGHLSLVPCIAAIPWPAVSPNVVKWPGTSWPPAALLRNATRSHCLPVPNSGQFRRCWTAHGLEEEMK